MDWQCVLTTIGCLGILCVVYRFLTSLWKILGPYVFYSPINLKKKAGAGWAVVTGATDGIGKAYAFELARRGFNVYLVSRTQSKLEDTKEEILEKHQNVEVRTYAYDFTDASVEGYQGLIDELNKVKVGILVNNVGLWFGCPQVLHEVGGGIETIRNVTTVNSLAPTLLTAGVLPQMVERKSGIIVNIGSSAGVHQLAMWSVYSATKKYVAWLSAILRKEYRSQGIIIQTIAPNLVATKMSNVKTTSLFTPSAEHFAKSALNTIGNTNHTAGYITHQIQQEFGNLLPTFILDRVIAKVNARMQNESLLKKN